MNAKSETLTARAESADAYWYRSLGKIIGDLENERLPGSLIEGLGRFIPFELATIFVYRGGSRPLHIYDNFKQAEAEQGIAAYVEGTYVINPF